MATLYVNKSGSDANNGSTVDLAKLTIAATCTAATSGDTIIVGSGLYNEKLGTQNKTMTLNADGTVIIDGTGISTNPMLTSNATLTMQPATGGGKWIIQNHVGNYIFNWSLTGTITLKSVEFYSNGQTYCIYTANSTGIVAQNCLFSGFTTFGLYTITSSITAHNCTFYNCGVALGGGVNLINLGGNIISNCTTGWQVASSVSSATSVLRNNQFYSVTNWKYGTTTYTTLADVQTAGWEQGSVVEQPNFISATNNLFYLTAASSLDRRQGAFPFGYARGQAYDPQSNWDIYSSSPDNSKWYNPDGNCSKNGTTGFLELSVGTSGVLWSPVYDLGTVQAIKQINLGVNQTWGTNMIDTTKTDVKPNYQTIEIRASGSSFNQDDAVISWTEVKTEQPISVISGRYVQVRLTLRSDDVAA